MMETGPLTHYEKSHVAMDEVLAPPPACDAATTDASSDAAIDLEHGNQLTAYQGENTH